MQRWLCDSLGSALATLTFLQAICFCVAPVFSLLSEDNNRNLSIGFEGVMKLLSARRFM